MSELVALSRDETKALAKCEKVIEQGYKTFIEVGAALASIRDSRLYRATHKTFEAYCTERWGWDRSYAYRLVASAETARQIAEGPEQCPPPANEAQVRELRRLPEPDRAGAWAEVVEQTGGKPTATATKGVVDLWLADEEPPDLDGESEPDDDVIDSTSEPATAADVLKEQVFSRVNEFHDVGRLLKQAGATLDQLAGDRDVGVYLNLYIAEVRRLVKQLQEYVKYGTPHAVCPWCKGDGCMACKQSGWVNKATYERAPASESGAA